MKANVIFTLAQGRVHTKIQTEISQKLLCQSESNFISLRKFLRIDSVISVNLYQISFLSLVLNIYKNVLSILKRILISSIFGKITIDDF